MGAFIGFLFFVGIVVVVLLVIAALTIRVVPEYERGVIFRLGRLKGAKGPGLFLLIPLADRMVKVDLRVVAMEIASQEAITRDNVTVKVSAVAYWQVSDPVDAVIRVFDYNVATWQIAQTSLRSVLGQSELDELLTHRSVINAKLQQIIDEQTEDWGIKVRTVEVKDVELPDTMKRAMAKQAEAEREKRAKVISAEGEKQASETLASAAHVLASEPVTIQLRYLQTLIEIASEKNSTVIFPFPIEFAALFDKLLRPGAPGKDET